MTAGDLSCKELVELVTEYLERTLPPPDRARFDAHLKDCDGCRIYLEQMRQTISALGTLTEETVPSEARQKLLDAFRRWKED